MIPTEEAIDQFLKYMSDRGFSENTVRAYRSDLKSMLSSVRPGEQPALDDLASRWLTASRDAASARTTKRRVSAVRAFARWAGQGNVLSDYRTPKPERAQPHPIPERIDGVITLLHAAETHHHRALVALTGLCGLRVSEARAVRPDDVDTVEQTVLVRGKGSKQRVVPISKTAWQFIEPAVVDARADGGVLVPISDRAARQYVTDLGERCGLTRSIATHDLRATLATEMHRNGASLRVVQEFLGHADPATTQVYTDATMDEMRSAAEVA